MEKLPLSARKDSSMPGHRRRLIQFSLRTFMILLTGGCIWLGWKVERARRQQAVIQLATQLGGKVLFDSEEKPIVAGTQVRYPSLFATLSNKPPVMTKWLRQAFGDGFFFNRSVVAVRFSGPNVKNADLEVLNYLPSLHSILLYNTSVDAERLRTTLPNCHIYAW